MSSKLPNVPIGEVVERIENWDPMNSSSKEPFRYIDISSIDRETKEVHSAPLIFPKEAPSRARQLVKAKDVIVSTVRPNLNAVAQVQEELDAATASTGFCVLRPNEKKLHPRFLYFWVRSPVFIGEMVNRATGASYPAVSDSIVKKSRIPLPHHDEQLRLAAILDKADVIRRKRHDSIHLSEEFIRYTFLEMFGDPVTNKKGWEVGLLGDVCDVRDGTHDSPKYVTNGGFPLVTSKNLTSGVVDLSDINYISEEDYIQINKRSKVELGNILLPMIGTIGTPVLVDQEPNFAIKNVALIKFAHNSPMAIYVKHLLSSHYFDYVIGQKSRGGTQQFISLGDLRKFPLLLPPKERQIDFVNVVTTVGKTLSKSFISRNHSDHLLNALIHRAFRGEL
jgi:type I restriction enzyme S subunit